MPKTRALTLNNYPMSGGRVNAGGQATAPENSFWESVNATSDFDGRISKRPGARQWAQSLKEPALGGMAWTELFNDLSQINVNDVAAGGNVTAELVNRKLVLTTTASTGGTEIIAVSRLAQSGDGTPAVAEAQQTSIRVGFRTIGSLPAQDTDSDRGPSILLRANGLVATQQYVFHDDGIYVFDASSNFTLIPGTDVDDGRWHTLEIQITSTGSEVTIDDGTPIVVSSVGAVASGVVENQIAFKARTNSNATYSIEFDFAMGRSGIDATVTGGVFQGAKISLIRDWSSASPIVDHLFVVAGKTIYTDEGHAGTFRTLDTAHADGLTELVPFLDNILILHPRRPTKTWGGKNAPEVVPEIPIKGRLGTEHLARLVLTTEDDPLRIFISGPSDLGDWNIGDPAHPALSAESVNLIIPDPRGQRITAMQGDYFGQLIIWTESSMWSLTGTGEADFVLRNLSTNIGCVGPRAFDRVANDIVFMSNHGMHSIATTQQYGDLQSSFLSAMISNLWNPNNQFNLPQIVSKYHSALVHIPHRNRTYLSVSLEGDTGIQSIFEFNHGTGQWTGPWKLDSEGIDFVLLGQPGLPMMIIGDQQGRVATVDDDAKRDWGTDAIPFRLRSPRLDGRSLDPSLVRRTKRWGHLRLFVLPRGKWDISIEWEVDDHPRVDDDARDQKLTEYATLTDTFVLGTSKIVDSERPHMIPVRLDKRGRWFEFVIEQNVVNQDIVIAGLQIDLSVSQDDLETS